MRSIRDRHSGSESFVRRAGLEGAGKPSWSLLYRRARARGASRQHPVVEDSGAPALQQAQGRLHRPASRSRKPADGTRAHELQPGLGAGGGSPENLTSRTSPCARLGREIRSAFVTDASGLGISGPTVLLSADYSQIELRVLAHAGEAVREAFRRARTSMPSPPPASTVCGQMKSPPRCVGSARRSTTASSTG